MYCVDHGGVTNRVSAEWMEKMRNSTWCTMLSEDKKQNLYKHNRESQSAKNGTRQTEYSLVEGWKYISSHILYKMSI